MAAERTAQERMQADSTGCWAAAAPPRVGIILVRWKYVAAWRDVPGPWDLARKPGLRAASNARDGTTPP